MTKTVILTSIVTLVSGCSTAPKCAISENSQTIFRDTKACEVRIKQVVVVSKMNLPNSVKAAELSTWRVEWVDSELRNGAIYGGHFALVPPQVPVKK